MLVPGINALKSFVTSAGNATAYVWSSGDTAGKGGSTIWLVPRDTKGVRVGGVVTRVRRATSIRWLSNANWQPHWGCVSRCRQSGEAAR